MFLQIKTFRQVGMTTVEPCPHRTSMTWTEISEMMINMRTLKELFNHMSQKKMLDKKFVDTHLPRSQEMAQEEDGDKEKEETQEDFLTMEERSQPLPPQDSTLAQGALPNKESQGRPQRRKRPLDKFQ